MPLAAPQLPSWVDTLRSKVTDNLKENKDLISYALATHDTATPHSDAPVPRVRYVVHRGFVNERRKDGDGSSNTVKDDHDQDLISDKLVITTDARCALLPLPLPPPSRFLRATADGLSLHRA